MAVKIAPKGIPPWPCCYSVIVESAFLTKPTTLETSYFSKATMVHIWLTDRRRQTPTHQLGTGIRCETRFGRNQFAQSRFGRNLREDLVRE